MDEIEVVDLRCQTRIGFRPHEMERKQEVVLNIRFHADLAAAAASDDVADSVDYRAVTKAVLAHVEAGDFMLLERLAEEVAGIVLAFPGVGACTVRAEKPGALRSARSVAVTVDRRAPPCRGAPVGATAQAGRTRGEQRDPLPSGRP